MSGSFGGCTRMCILRSRFGAAERLLVSPAVSVSVPRCFLITCYMKDIWESSTLSTIRPYPALYVNLLMWRITVIQASSGVGFAVGSWTWRRMFGKLGKKGLIILLRSISNSANGWTAGVFQTKTRFGGSVRWTVFVYNGQYKFSSTITRRNTCDCTSWPRYTRSWSQISLQRHSKARIITLFIKQYPISRARTIVSRSFNNFLHRP